MLRKKRRSGGVKLLFATAAAIAVLLVGSGCPTSGNDDDGDNIAFTIPPEKPVIGSKIETGFELVDVDLKNITVTEANNEANQSAVVSFTWTGEGAASYNVYVSEEAVQPGTTAASGLTSTSYFARNLKPEMNYYFWVEAVNPIGKTVSDSFQKTTGKKGPQDSGGMERGDYTKGIRIVPGNGSLTVSWDLSDRVGWYEVYYSPAGAIKYLDINAPLRFRYDKSQALLPGAVDISGASNADSVSYKEPSTGHTRAVYPLLTPLAGNGGWTGYVVRDGDNGVDDQTHPVLGTKDERLKDTFYKLMEIYDDVLKNPYKPLDSLLETAIPWTGTQNGTPGTPVKFFGTSTTITGLENGKTYDVWIRSPNANGERGYNHIAGKAGTDNALPAPSNIQVTAPQDTSGNLLVSWNAVSGAENYRIYSSKYSYTPSATKEYDVEVNGTETSCLLGGLETETAYFVWVVAVKGGLPGNFSEPKSGKTGAPPAVTAKIGDKIIAGTTDKKVKTVVYIEVNDDNPLNAGSYILEDGTYLFDHVVLFAANIRNRSCNGDAGCYESGPHVHFNSQVRAILNDRNKYIKPLQDKGIKVLLGLLGDHDGIGFGSMTDDQRTAFIADLKNDVQTNGLDGVDFDDEWAGKESGTTSSSSITNDSIWVYPVTTVSSNKIYRNPNMGVVTGNGQAQEPNPADMTRMWSELGQSYYKTILAARQALGSDKIITFYEYNTGRVVTAGGEPNGEATKEGLQGAINFALQPWYNEYRADSANGLPRSIYSPFGMDLSGEAYAAQNGAPNPPIVIGGNAQASDTIYDYATRFKKAATDGDEYGLLYFYGLESARELLKRASSDSSPSVTKEEYISMMTSIVFGQKCIVTKEGGNYSRDY